MLTGIWIVFRKELIYTLRDRKTLIFMLMVPLLCLPLLTFAAGQIVLRTQKELAVKVVRVAATPETVAAYQRLVHTWFLDTEVAQGVRLISSPVVRALIRPEELEALGELSPEVLEDPAAFDRWTRQLVGLARAGLETGAPRGAEPAVEVPDSVRALASDYYQVVFKGLGLIEFVDPARLPAAPEDFTLSAASAELGALPTGRRIAWAIKSGQVHGYLEVPAESATLVTDDGQALEITFWYDSTDEASQEADRRIATVTAATSECLVGRRLAARGMPASFVQPLAMKSDTDLATRSERGRARIAGLLPMFVITFTLLGGLYPAIDLGAGEKERYTLETLLLCPLGRTEIALGKALVIFVASLVAALLSLAALGLSFSYMTPPEFQRALDLHVGWGTTVAVVLLSIPPAIGFAGILLAISIYARSFKEAQNYMTAPLYVIMFVPLVAVIPGIELDWRLACLPLVNVALLARDFLKGDPNWGYYAATLGSCLVLAALCVTYAAGQFRNERVLFRS